MTQTEALAIMLAGNSVLLTGAAGTGKTYTLNKYIRLARAAGKSVSVTATTGLAATHINGCTIHSWAGIGIRNSLNKSFFDNMPKNRIQIINNTDVLIIDEVSMLHDYRLDLVDNVCRVARETDKPFGGIQVIFCGDFFQLPPIQENEYSGNAFITNSSAWQELEPDICYLKKQFRQQNDNDYAEILNGIRDGYLRPSQINQITSRLNHQPSAEELSEITRIYTMNRNVDSVNSKRLAEIDSDSKTYYATYSGRKDKIELLKKSSLASEELSLKIGAFVMFIKNSLEKKYINGSLGIVESFDKESGYPQVRLKNGNKVLAKPDTWELADGDKTVASMSQIPLKLAWAITVHKSQGMSLDSAVINLSETFVEGMGYVALSRVKSIDNLYLEGMNNKALLVSAEAKVLNKKFLEFSEQSKIKHKDTINKYKEEAKNPVNNVKLNKWSDKLQSMREKYPNAYKPWTEKQDKKLIELFSEGKTISELSKKFGRHKGSIKSRISKHLGEDIWA
jgi:ATP-dependent DNA helicase PIF1